MSSNRENISSVEKVYNKNLHKQIALAVSIVAIMAIPLTLSMDNHFVVKLTEEFTSSSNSDYNCFTIMMEEQSITNGEINKEINIEYNKTSGEIQKTFTQPRSDKIIGFKNTAMNHTNSSYIDNIYYTQEFNENIQYNDISNYTANDEMLYMIKSNESNNHMYYIENIRNYLEAIPPIFNGTEKFIYGLEFFPDMYLLNDYNVVQVVNVPQDITFKNLYMKIRYNTKVEPVFPIYIRAKITEIPGGVISNKLITINNPAVLINLNIDLISSQMTFYSSKTYKIELSDQSDAYIDNNILLGLRESPANSLGNLIWKTFLEIPITETTKELWLYFVEVIDFYNDYNTSYSYGPEYKIINIPSMINLLDIPKSAYNIYNASIVFDISINYTTMIGYNISKHYDLSLIDLGYQNPLTNGTNIYTITNDSILNHIDTNKIFSFMLTFVSKFNFTLILHDFYVNLTYIGADDDITINIETIGNTNFQTLYIIETNETYYGILEIIQQDLIFMVNITFVIQSPTTTISYSYVYIIDYMSYQEVKLINKMNENPFELNISYFGSTIVVFETIDEKEIIKHDNDFDVYI